jgi:hypothetical protein
LATLLSGTVDFSVKTFRVTGFDMSAAYKRVLFTSEQGNRHRSGHADAAGADPYDLRFSSSCSIRSHVESIVGGQIPAACDHRVVDRGVIGYRCIEINGYSADRSCQGG